MGTLALIGLGSNLGDRRAILDGAIAAMAETPGVEVRAVSSYHETAPVGGPAGQGAFLNAVAALQVALDIRSLHGRLLEIEQAQGRVRVVRWGERTLDLDILLFGDEVIQDHSLTVPHPRMTFRRFVLAPAAEIARDIRDPLTGRTIGGLLELIDRRPGYVAFQHGFGVGDIDGDRLFARVTAELRAVGLSRPTIQIGRHSKLARRSSMLSRVAESMITNVSEAIQTPGVGWVTSDYWIDGLYHWAIPRLEPNHPGFGVFRSRFAKARRAAPTPTIVVRPRGTGPPRPAWSDRVASLDPEGFSPSFLDLDSGDEDNEVAEVLAACAATRS